jgi:hypothetical protein
MIEVSFGSNASFDASGSDFRYHPERRHLLALQYLTKRATNGRRSSSFFKRRKLTKE